MISERSERFWARLSYVSIREEEGAMAAEVWVVCLYSLRVAYELCDQRRRAAEGQRI